MSPDRGTGDRREEVEGEGALRKDRLPLLLLSFRVKEGEDEV